MNATGSILLPQFDRLAILLRPMSTQKNTNDEPTQASETDEVVSLDDVLDKRPKEIGGPKGPEPTRYGDWERKGRCIDF